MCSKPTNFYSDLDYLDNFQDISNFTKYTAFPESWMAVLTDIKGSTKAVEEGRYKDVNFIGAAVIIAMQNLATNHNLPFIFGGDGATLFIPHEFYEETKLALANTQILAKTSFDLDLRCMIYPISELAARGLEVKVSKLKISNLYTQAMLTGSGLDFLENILKQNQTEYHIIPKIQGEPNFSGLTCRWQDVPSRFGEIVTLIVKTKSSGPQQMHDYSEVLKAISKVYGNSDDFNPIDKENVHLSLNIKQLAAEAKLFSFEKGLIAQKSKQVWYWIVNLYGIITGNNNKLVDTKKNNLVVASDFKKFDGTLKMVIAGNLEQRLMLLELLDEMVGRGKILYGYHLSDKATMTCLVYSEGNSEVHFVDGAGGGYTLAAKMLKERIKMEV